MLEKVEGKKYKDKLPNFNKSKEFDFNQYKDQNQKCIEAESSKNNIDGHCFIT